MTTPSVNHSQFIIYQTEDGETKLDVRFENETVWLTQKLMAELFTTTPENILMHLSRSHAPAWECIPAQNAALYAFPPRTVGMIKTYTDSHGGPWEPEPGG
jgi:hypothetical protein